MRRLPVRRSAVCGIALLAALTSCRHRQVARTPPPPIRYVVGPSWQADGVWYYPRENFALSATGIAMVLPALHPRLTTDNEPYDPQAMTAAMQAVQLPAIATVTNLDTGRQLRLRINDRGPDTPTRLIAVTPRAAALLGITTGAARIRVVFDEAPTAALSRQTQGAAGDLALQTAPQGSVQQATLAPLAGTVQAPTRAVRSLDAVDQATETGPIEIPLHLPADVTVGSPEPGALMIDAGSFTHDSAARARLAALAGTGARLERVRTGRQTTISVVAGPYDDIPAADAALSRMIDAGATDARITVDTR